MNRDQTDTPTPPAPDAAESETIRCWPYVLLGIFLPIVSFPLVLALLSRRLRRHVDRRLASPAFQSKRFAGPTGQEIVHRLRKCRGRFRNPLAAILLIQYLLWPSLIAFHVFAVPAMMPGFRYREVMASILEIRQAGTQRVCQSRDQYESHSAPSLRGVLYKGMGPLTEEEAARLPVVEALLAYSSQADQLWRVDVRGRLVQERPPYEGRCISGDGRWYRVRVMIVGYRWRGTEVLGAILYAVLVPIQFVSAMMLYSDWWIRFARHRQAELAAASLTSGNLRRLRAELLKREEWENLRLLVVTMVAAMFQIVMLPFSGPLIFSRHHTWERLCRVEETLGAP